MKYCGLYHLNAYAYADPKWFPDMSPELRDMARPPGNCRNPRPTFPYGAFGSAEWGVPRVGIDILPCTIIGGEDNQRVVRNRAKPILARSHWGSTSGSSTFATCLRNRESIFRYRLEIRELRTPSPSQNRKRLISWRGDDQERVRERIGETQSAW
jgi:hypothetical protein